MKIIQRERLIDEGEISSTPEWQEVEKDILDAVATVQWPKNSGSFTLYPEKHGNGVVPIKEACMIHLKSKNWIISIKRGGEGWVAGHEKDGPTRA